LTRAQVAEIRKSADTIDDPNRKVFTTEDYKEFQNVIDEANKFMKANKQAKFSVVVTCEFVPLEKVEKNVVTNQTEKPS
jgi:Ser-tRNA(Ala) deacylase AlaX